MAALVSNPRNRSLLLLCLLLLAALGLDAWQRAAQRAGGQTWLENLVCASAAPVQVVLVRLSLGMEAGWTALGRARQLEQENVRLAAKVGELQARLNRAEEADAKSARERGLRSAYPGSGRSARVAHIVGVGSGGWLSYLVVDRGSADGTRLRDVAVTREGVVGQVYAVASHSARVLPITDRASGVAVRVHRSRETGVLKGAGEWRAELRYLGPEAQVRPGDELVTAGTGGVFPKGLRVGRVTAVILDPNTSGRIALVAPAAKLRDVEEVLLLRRHER